MSIKPFIIASLPVILLSCNDSVTSFSEAIIELSTTNLLDSVKVSDTVLFKEKNFPLYISVLKKDSIIGLVMRKRDLEKTIIKVPNSPLFFSDSLYFGSRLYSADCINCHSGEDKLANNLSSLADMSKPLEVVNQTDTLWYISNHNLHWRILFYSDNQKESLRKYLRSIEGRVSD